MSKKEAIDLLTYVRDGLAEERGSDYSGVEAVQMAINAFEQPETHDKRTETHSCDLIDRQAAIDAVRELYIQSPKINNDIVYDTAIDQAHDALVNLPSAQPEPTEYIPDTKAVPSRSDCVCLSERVSTTFYDDEHEEWSQKTVTIADILDRVCDGYTVLPSAQPDDEMIHLQKEQVYMQGWEDGQKALREEIWERERDRLN